VNISAQNLVWLWERALKVDRKKITELRAANRSTAIAGYLAQCLYGL
jgi:rhodanese-related sulfurtransferase